MKKENLPITRNEAFEILREMNQNDFDMTHYLESEAIMKALAKKLGKDEDYWGMVGLLHDVDWHSTKTDLKNHCIHCVEILREHGFDDHFIEIVQSHAYGHDAVPELREHTRLHAIEHSLVAAETLTGLIYTYALMRDGRVSDMTVKGLKKKFKDKNFAKGVDRELITEIEEVGIELGEFFELAINAVRGIKHEIGLK
ncbi:HDIG domain-containing protein [Candidatus Pacearchaeota archaeon]|nr:HDIG domain-containing protein [Candidatus Pacearchaeota archaeon]